VYRRFCLNCGSGIIADVAAMPGMTLVLVGSLDDTAVVNPAMEVYCSSAQPGPKPVQNALASPRCRADCAALRPRAMLR
jgi:hypothetical protein